MYSASDAFHEAIEENQPQKVLIIFSDCVFTNEDIDVEQGIQFNDYFNTEEDISIGQALSNEISFTLFNDDRLLNNYEFGEFLATIGVRIDTDTYQQTGGVKVKTNNNIWVGSDSYPFITCNGTAVSVQPSFAVKSLLGYDGKLYAFGNNKQYAVYDDSTKANITNSNRLNNFMKAKSIHWNGKGMFYNKRSRMLFIYEAGVREQYEFVPLGWFTADRPNAPDNLKIDMTCNDFMTKFDDDMPSKTTLGISYPCTISTLFKALCNHVDVDYVSSSFINSSATIQSEPDEFSTATMRDVIKWIAEAAGGNAKFNRDGQLKVDTWITSTNKTVTANSYSSFDPYWYNTGKVTKLYNQASDGSYSNSLGSGSEAYLIQDNPLLEGVS